MNQPVRKPTRLHEFNYSSNGSYFLTICVKNAVLCDIVANGDGLPEICLTEAGRIAEKNIVAMNRAENVEVEKYVIMPDHIHLIVFVKNAEGEIDKGKTPANEKIPQIISAFKRLTQKELGKKIFQRGYYDHVIRDDKDFDTKWRYIDENPSNWLENKKYRELKEKTSP